MTRAENGRTREVRPAKIMRGRRGILERIQLTRAKALTDECVRVQSRVGCRMELIPDALPGPENIVLFTREQPPLLVSRSLSKERCYNRAIMGLADFDCR